MPMCYSHRQVRPVCHRCRCARQKTGARGSDTVTLLEAEHGALPPTFTVRTKSGGKHYWYRGKGKSGARNLGPAADTPAAPRRCLDGVDYVALNDLPIAEAPQWAVELAGKASAKERPEDANVPAPGVTLNIRHQCDTAMDYALHQAPGAPVHQRDVTTWNVACAVRDFGLSFDVALRIVRDFLGPARGRRTRQQLQRSGCLQEGRQCLQQRQEQAGRESPRGSIQRDTRSSTGRA